MTERAAVRIPEPMLPTTIRISTAPEEVPRKTRGGELHVANTHTPDTERRGQPVEQIAPEWLEVIHKQTATANGHQVGRKDGRQTVDGRRRKRSIAKILSKWERIEKFLNAARR